MLIVGDSMVNDIEDSKLSKTSHIRVQPLPGGKLEDIQQNLDLETDIIHTGTSNATTSTPQVIVNKLITKNQRITTKMSLYHKQINRKNR